MMEEPHWLINVLGGSFRTCIAIYVAELRRYTKHAKMLANDRNLSVWPVMWLSLNRASSHLHPVRTVSPFSKKVILKKRGERRDRIGKTANGQKERLTSCCWSVFLARRSCNCPAECQSGVTGPYRSRRCSPRQSSHQTDPGPRRRCCASAGRRDNKRALKPCDRKQGQL